MTNYPLIGVIRVTWPSFKQHFGFRSYLWKQWS